MYKCEFCDFVGTRIMSHLKSKHQSCFKSTNDLIIHVLEIRNKFITKELLYSEYVVHGQSYTDIKEKYDISFTIIKQLMDIHGIQPRDLRDSAIIAGEKIRHTLMVKYGVDNISKIKSVKEKKRKTSNMNYGVDNIWKLKNYHDICNEQYKSKNGITLDQKRSETLKLLYSTDESKKLIENMKMASLLYWSKITQSERTKRNNNISEKLLSYYRFIDKETLEIRNNKISKSHKSFWDNLTADDREKRTRHLININKSSLETRVMSILSSNNIPFNEQFYLDGKYYDIKIGNTLFELNGDFWHANPEIYEAEDLLNFPGGKIKAKELWKKDKMKLDIADEYGIICHFLWEKDMKNLSDNELLILLLELTI